MKGDRIRDLIDRFTLKGWTLRTLLDAHVPPDDFPRPPNHCDYCGTQIRWVYVLGHQTDPHWHAKSPNTIFVGGECVKSFIDPTHAQESLKFLQERWSQKRTYFYKRFRDLTVVIGQQKNGDWYVATTPTLDAYPWTFIQPTTVLANTNIRVRVRLRTSRAAQAFAVAHMISTGGQVR